MFSGIFCLCRRSCLIWSPVIVQVPDIIGSDRYQYTSSVTTAVLLGALQTEARRRMRNHELVVHYIVISIFEYSGNHACLEYTCVNVPFRVPQDWT